MTERDRKESPYRNNFQKMLAGFGPSSFQKAWAYFMKISKSDAYLESVDQLSKKYSISKQLDEMEFNNQRAEEVVNSLELDIDEGKIRKEVIERICSKFSLSDDFADLIVAEIVYSAAKNSIPYDIGLCKTEETSEEAYPITVKISPYASKRDVLGYIEWMYKHQIKPLQEKYKKPNVKLGSVRTSSLSLEERNDFIYNNRHRAYAEIAKMIPKRFGESLPKDKVYLDVGHIGKIISLERKSRKEV